mmetsp:Transcript_5810/g.14100  ORF Transcript_5810/g.14100 Transcript_5810/m.14100 type:complete len:248 (-) Transcript_5810:813-1556(-)
MPIAQDYSKQQACRSCNKNQKTSTSDPDLNSSQPKFCILITPPRLADATHHSDLGHQATQDMATLDALSNDSTSLGSFFALFSFFTFAFFSRTSPFFGRPFFTWPVTGFRRSFPGGKRTDSGSPPTSLAEKDADDEILCTFRAPRLPSSSLFTSIAPVLNPVTVAYTALGPPAASVRLASSATGMSTSVIEDSGRILDDGILADFPDLSSRSTRPCASERTRTRSGLCSHLIATIGEWTSLSSNIGR